MRYDFEIEEAEENEIDKHFRETIQLALSQLDGFEIGLKQQWKRNDISEAVYVQNVKICTEERKRLNVELFALSWRRPFRIVVSKSLEEIEEVNWVHEGF